MENLKEGEIYYHDNGGYGWVFRFTAYDKTHYKGKSCIATKDSSESFDNNRYSNPHEGELRNSTPEEAHWLKECEKANKFISKEEALKSFNNVENQILDQWLKETKDRNLTLDQLEHFIASGMTCPLEAVYKKLEGRRSREKAIILHALWNKQPEFVVGKWYFNSAWKGTDIIAVKYSKHTTKGYNQLYFEEEIKNHKYYKYGRSDWYHFNEGIITEVSLEEIQHYLPEGHVDKIVKSTELTSVPEKWYILRTPENHKVINKWFLDNGYGTPSANNGNISIRPCKTNYDTPSSIWAKEKGYTEITFEQFKKWVLKDIAEEPKSLVGRYVKALVDSPRSGSIKKGDIGIIKENGYIDFPRHYNYSWTLVSNEEGTIHELMPEGFTPDKDTSSTISGSSVDYIGKTIIEPDNEVVIIKQNKRKPKLVTI
jgi:hypothetical protein